MPKYLLGILVLIIGQVAHLGALPFADLVLLSANGTTAILANALVSIKWLGESFVCKYDLSAWIIITLGATLIVFFSNTNTLEYEPEQIAKLIWSPAYLVTYVILTLFSLAIFFYGARFKKKLRKFEEDMCKWAVKCYSKLSFEERQ